MKTKFSLYWLSRLLTKNPALRTPTAVFEVAAAEGFDKGSICRLLTMKMSDALAEVDVEDCMEMLFRYRDLLAEVEEKT